jgi:hypothetical protein
MQRMLMRNKGLVGAAVAAIVALLGYRRYKSVKVGDRVQVKTAQMQSLGVPAGTTVEAIVASLGPGTAAGVSPIIAGVQSPMSVPIQQSDIVANLTPRLV